MGLRIVTKAGKIQNFIWLYPGGDVPVPSGYISFHHQTCSISLPVLFDANCINWEYLGETNFWNRCGGTLSSLAAVYPLMLEQKTVNSILWLATPSSYFTGPACNIFQHTLLLMVFLLTDPTFVLKILRSHKENASSSEDKTVRHPNQAKRNASPWCSVGGPFFKFWSSGFGSEYVFKSVFPNPVFLNSHLKTL